MNITKPAPISRRWTNAAIECISNRCVCGTCPMMDKVYHCQMKRTVLDLVRKYGTPEGYIEPTIREEE